ncbi:MAG: phage baseplate assembly protein V [Nitrososphaerota archaeon]
MHVAEWYDLRPYTDMGYFLGVVEDNEDPKKLGRVKVRSPLYGDIPKDDLPWAWPLFLAFPDTDAGMGSFHIPKVGSEVLLHLPFGDPHLPAYSFRVMSEPKAIDEDFLVHYPNRYGWQDEKGNRFMVDKEQGFMRIRHHSGVVVHINDDGDVKILQPSGKKLYIDNQVSHFTGHVKIDGYLVVGSWIQAPLYTSVAGWTPDSGSAGDAHNINQVVAKLNAFIGTYNSHTHIDSRGGGTSPPSPTESPKPPDGTGSPSGSGHRGEPAD